MKAELLWTSARSAVLEVKGCGYYEAEEAHKVYVNGELSVETKKNIVTVGGLLPDTKYEITVCHKDETDKLTVM